MVQGDGVWCLVTGARGYVGSGSGSVYRQRAVFIPRGLAGHLYW